jgi:hypothetical protein
MTEKHPYMSGSAGLVQAVNHLRKSFPKQVTADTLKKLGIAPNNETYVLNILRFVQVLDEKGNKADKANTVFTRHNDAEFQKAFAEMVETAYADLFTLHGKEAWTLPVDKLISYFRSTDHTSALVGHRQANTFQTLASLSGHAEVPVPKPSKPVRRLDKKPAEKQSKKVLLQKKPQVDDVHFVSMPSDVKPLSLTVRIEINLPVSSDQETYDRIFKSIRENLISGE